jgi:hypothetical protein
MYIPTLTLDILISLFARFSYIVLKKIKINRETKKINIYNMAGLGCHGNEPNKRTTICRQKCRRPVVLRKNTQDGGRKFCTLGRFQHLT